MITLIAMLGLAAGSYWMWLRSRKESRFWWWAFWLIFAAFAVTGGVRMWLDHPNQVAKDKQHDHARALELAKCAQLGYKTAQWYYDDKDGQQHFECIIPIVQYLHVEAPLCNTRSEFGDPACGPQPERSPPSPAELADMNTMSDTPDMHME